MCNLSQIIGSVCLVITTSFLTLKVEQFINIGHTDTEAHWSNYYCREFVKRYNELKEKSDRSLCVYINELIDKGRIREIKEAKTIKNVVGSPIIEFFDKDGKMITLSTK